MDADERVGPMGGGRARGSAAFRRRQGAWKQMIDETMTRKIRAQLDAAPVVLFMKGTPDFPQCGFSAQTAGALRALKANYLHVNIFEEPELREALKAYSSWPTYPQLYVKGELVGGCDIVTEMYRSGELKTLLADAGAIA
jgi:monothiol glutaredoxin